MTNCSMDKTSIIFSDHKAGVVFVQGYSISSSDEDGHVSNTREPWTVEEQQ